MDTVVNNSILKKFMLQLVININKENLKCSEVVCIIIRVINEMREFGIGFQLKTT